MGLNIGASGGFKTFIKYNAKAGRWFLRDSDGDKEIPMPLGFVADMDNIATGWMKYQEGQAPQRRFDPDLQTPAPSPGEGFKRGFVMMVFSVRFFGGAAEFGGNSIHLANAFKDVYAEWEAGRGANPGKLPVIRCDSVEPMKDKHGTNYRPKLVIAQWVERPNDLPDVIPIEADEVWRGGATQAPARSPAQHVPPPATPAPAAAASASLSETMF